MIAVVAALFLALLPVPNLSGPVVDQAGVLSGQERRALEELARRTRAAEGGQGPQMAFLVVPSLDGEPIEDYSIRVAEAWQLGSAGRDNGLLFVVSTGDRKVRIEVGGGLEGEITDAQASRLIREVITPAFRAGRYGEGLILAAQRAVAYTGVEPVMRGAPRRNQERGTPLVALLFFGSFFFLRMLGGRGRRGFWIGGPMGMGGGYRGGGGLGGGGFRGGGGGFSGGGASGSW